MLPAEFTGIKMEVIKSELPAGCPLASLPQHFNYFLLAATLRPETMYVSRICTRTRTRTPHTHALFQAHHTYMF